MGPSRRAMLAWLSGWLGLSWINSTHGEAPAWERPPGRESGDAGAEPAIYVPLDVRAGAVATIDWHGKPVFIRHRTAAEITRERAVPLDDLRDPESDQARTKRAEWVVVEGICTHGGCIPNGPLGDYGGWYCFCHGSQFDTAGRVRAGPARENLKIPPYQFVDEQTLRIGPLDS